LATWLLNVPKELSETGIRQQLFFGTKKEAQIKAGELKSRKHNFGVSLALLSSNQITQAVKAYQMLNPYGLIGEVSRLQSSGNRRDPSQNARPWRRYLGSHENFWIFARIAS
jgi:hypothetical protein